MTDSIRDLTMPFQELTLRSRALILCGALCVLGFSVPADADDTFTTFDPPQSIATYALSINSSGSITGWYQTKPGAQRPSRGFVRAPDGTIVTFHAGPSGTYARSINDTGSIVGDCQDITGKSHGFVRAADGAITTFDPPESINTYAMGINAGGSIAGYYLGSTGSHGFVRAPDGAFASFDLPGSTALYVTSINGAGAIAGDYQDSAGRYHGFARTPDGTITVFDLPGSAGTVAASINATGSIAGSFSGPYTSSGGTGYYGFMYGFMRAADGTFTVFQVPAMNSTDSINDQGSIAGTTETCVLEWCSSEGFVRAADGTVTTFGLGQFSMGISINSAGSVTGSYSTDDLMTWHGFLRTP